MNDDFTPNENGFRHPLESTRTRGTLGRSRGSLKGLLVAQTPADPRPRKYFFESKLEQRLLYLLLAQKDTHAIQDQPPAITYVDDSGKPKRHMFDYLATLNCGTKIALAAKPASMVRKLRFREELRRIRAATDLTYADKVVLVTDKSFSPSEARNAARLHSYRIWPDSDADAVIADLIARLSVRETTMATLATESGLGGRGFRAAFRAIYAGALRTLDNGDIQPSTRIIREDVE